MLPQIASALYVMDIAGIQLFPPVRVNRTATRSLRRPRLLGRAGAALELELVQEAVAVDPAAGQGGGVNVVL